MQPVLICANPIAGSGRGGSIARRVYRTLLHANIDAQLWMESPAQLAEENFNPDCAAVIAIGGDGTVRAVAERLAELSRARSREMPPLLIIPLGTANLLGRHLGIDWKISLIGQQVLDALQHRTVVHLDTARANNRLFLLMAGVGFDAAVVHEMTRVRSGPISYFSYLEPAARMAGSYRFPPIRVKVDGAEIFGPTPGVAFIGNVREYGTGFPMLPMARGDDGLLDVCCMPCRNVLEGARLFLAAAAGEHLQQEGVIYTKGKHITVESTTRKKVPVQIDGDAAGFLPLKIDLLPERLALIVPRH